MEGIKYADKSAGQENLVPIFDELCRLMKPYQKGALKMSGGSGGKMILASDKKVIVAGKERDGVWFAAALVQKGYVGFYYMPINSDQAIRGSLNPAFLKMLKGKSCFHIKKFDKETFEQVKKALKLGYGSYVEKGWV